MDSLDEDWLAVELEASCREVEEWSGGLKESFESLVAETTETADSQELCDLT